MLPCHKQTYESIFQAECNAIAQEAKSDLESVKTMIKSRKNDKLIIRQRKKNVKQG